MLRDDFAQFRTFLDAEGIVEEETLKGFSYESVIQNRALIEVLQEFVQ